MSQSMNSKSYKNKDSKQSNKYVSKKRIYRERQDFSDEEILGQEGNLDSNDEDDSQRNKKSKSKKLGGNLNFLSLRQIRQIQKYTNKENNILTQDQLDFAKKVIDSNKDGENKTEKIENTEITEKIFRTENLSKKNMNHTENNPSSLVSKDLKTVKSLNTFNTNFSIIERPFVSGLLR